MSRIKSCFSFVGFSKITSFLRKEWKALKEATQIRIRNCLLPCLNRGERYSQTTNFDKKKLIIANSGVAVQKAENLSLIKAPENLGEIIAKTFKFKDFCEELHNFQSENKAPIISKAFENISQEYTEEQLLGFGKQTKFFAAFDVENLNQTEKVDKVRTYIKDLFCSYAEAFFTYEKKPKLKIQTHIIENYLRGLIRRYLECSIDEKDLINVRKVIIDFFRMCGLGEFVTETFTEKNKDATAKETKNYGYRYDHLLTSLKSHCDKLKECNYDLSKVDKSWLTPLTLFDHLFVE